jgi:uncharacterized protein (DUF3084 family)
MKTILPWILVLGLSAGMAAVYVSGTKKDAELTTLRAESQEVQQLRTELAEAKDHAKAQEEEIAGLHKDTQELLRLRNEIGKLRDDKQQLSKQMQAVQTEAQQAQSQAAQTIQVVQRMRTEAQLTAQRDQCINNLRQLDGAKQQWALEKGKTAEAVPTAQDIIPFLKDNKLPVCPARGTYTLNAVNQLPTCSIPGHELPK